MSQSVAYINGRIYTMEAEGDTCTAFVVQDGKFRYCGSDDEARRMAEEVIDLQGAAVVPGMIDTHQHLFAYASSLSKLDLKPASSLQQLKELLRDYAAGVPAGEWILGVGFDNEKFTDGNAMPTRQDLDDACPDHPVILSRYCLHFFSANSLGLARGGIDRNYKPAVEGTVEFGPDGEPTGVLCDSAAADVLSAIPDPLAAPEAKKAALEHACRQLNSHGLTGVHAIQGKHCDLMEYTDLYQALKEEDRLSVRVYLSYDELPNCCIRTGLGDDMLKFGFYKLYVDGNMGGRTAYMKEPYSDDPATVGVSNYTQQALTQCVRAGYARGMQVGAHVIGDRAAEMLTTAIEAVYHENPRPDPRFRMIHMSILNADIVRRISKLPVIVDIQPMFISTNVKWADSRVGAGERGKYLFAWKKLLDAGVMMTAGSDNPCESYDPMESIYALVNRKNLECYPEGGWHPEERIGVYDALAMYTRNAAYSSFEEDQKGTIKAGKLADFVVLDADIFRIDPMKIKDVKVEKTYLGGRLVYAR